MARDDPQPGVRHHALAVLTGRLSDSPRVRDLCRELLAAPDEELRLRAALALGEEGREVLLAIAAHPHGDNPRAVRAIASLGGRLPSARSLATLDEARARGWRAVALAAIDALGLVGDDDAVHRLAWLLREPDLGQALAAARALARTGQPKAEPALVDALRDPRPELQRAAAEALGQLGSAGAVGPLLTLAECGNASLRGTARQAIALIRSRLPGASAGQLSLAAGQNGRLSLASEEAGRLSFVERKS